MKRLQEVANYFVSAYLVIMAIIYPLYTKNGYKKIGETKFEFWNHITVSAMLILVVFSLILFFLLKQRNAYLLSQDNFSLTDTFFILYGFSVILSYSMSDYKAMDLWGRSGWNMGCFTQLLLVLCYFCISRLWNYKDYMWGIFLVGSAVVFLLGILNRFSIYPIAELRADPDFISTMGNINWFCGYWSVLWPVGICLFLFYEARLVRIGAGIYLLIAYAAGMVQGSNSAFISLAFTYYILFFIIRKKRIWWVRYLETAIIWCVAAQIIRLMRFLFPDRYNYSQDNLCGWATASPLFLYIGIILGICLCISLLIPKNGQEGLIYILKGNIVKVTAIVIPALLLACYLVIAFLNTNSQQGVLGLKENEAFILDENWGSSRGATWKAGIMIYHELPTAKKIFGAGPDCFSEFAYENGAISKMLRDRFGDLELTNAHNEGITMLVNLGALGFLCYAGIFLSIIVKGMKKGGQDSRFFLPAICAVSYASHNMVSFAQILNLPFIIIIFAMGESLYRRYRSGCEIRT